MSLEAEGKVKERDLVIEPASMKGELEPITYVMLNKAELVTGFRRLIPSPLFAVLVVIPMIFGFVYNFIIASDRFTSTASFVVRQNKQGTGLASVIDGGNGLGRSDENSYAVSDFIYSRDAIEEINHDGFLSRAFSYSGGDIFSRFPSIFTGDKKEDFFLHFNKYIEVDFNTSTGITSIEVQAFTPEDAYQIAQRLVAASEKLVNGLNSRAQEDATRFSSLLVEEGRQNLGYIQEEITRYRNKNKILNVDSEVSVSSSLISGILSKLTSIDTEIAQIMSMTPNNPKLPDLRLRREALSSQLDRLRQEIAGSDSSIATKMERFEELSIRQKIAQSNLIAAEASLLKARQSAAMNKLYLDLVVAPNIADKYSHPSRFKNVILLIFVSLSIFTIIRSLNNLIMEDA